MDYQGSIGQNQARELAGKPWAFDGHHCCFADFDPRFPGDPPWRSGSEGIAYPLLGTNGKPWAYVKFFESSKVSAKRIERTKWLIEQRIDLWAPELRAAPSMWLDTQIWGQPQAVTFQFACPLARAAPGGTWLEVKADVCAGVVQLSSQIRWRCVENFLRSLVLLERADMIHGDLSHNNIVVDVHASHDEPVLYLIDFDGFVAPKAGRLSQLSTGEGGTYGTNHYCPPELQQRAAQNSLSAVPYSDRHARDALLVELLCFNEDCDCEEPASKWDREMIAGALKNSPIGKNIDHLSSKDLFDQNEDQRPSSLELARGLRISTPPRVKRRRTISIASQPTWMQSSASPRSVTYYLRQAVFVLWVVCVAHLTLISVLAPRLLLPAQATAASVGSRGIIVLLVARSLLGLGMFIAGLIPLSILAFAQSEPRSVNLLGLWVRIPALRTRRRPQRRQATLLVAQMAVVFMGFAAVGFLIVRSVVN